MTTLRCAADLTSSDVSRSSPLYPISRDFLPLSLHATFYTYKLYIGMGAHEQKIKEINETRTTTLFVQ